MVLFSSTPAFSRRTEFPVDVFSVPTLTVPDTSSVADGAVVPMPRYPDELHIPDPGKYVDPENVLFENVS